MARARCAFRLLGRALSRRPPVSAVSPWELRLTNGARRMSDLTSAPGLPIDSPHTVKWMTNFAKKSPMELIAEIPPVEVQGRVVACEGGKDPALGHPIEYISVDLAEPAVCKYCGLRFVQAHGHHGGH